MELSTFHTLAALNRRFYEQHAAAFADSRPRLQTGVRRLLGRIPPGARVLDLGCGDGHVARALAGVDYVGVDQSEVLLRRAVENTTKDERRRTKAEPSFVVRPSSFVWLHLDLLSHELATHLPPGPFDFLLAFAVFHHLPGYNNRQRLLTHLATRLASGGVFVMSNWQFQSHPRFRQRTAPWADIGLTEADVEAGDALLTWERNGQHGLRYVHALDQAEARALTTAAGLTITETFTADGHTGDLAEYVVARPQALSREK